MPAGCAMDHADIVETLNRLIETALDGEQGLRGCARHVAGAPARERLLRQADDCRDAAATLRRLIVENGGSAESHGSAGGALQRGWVAVKAALGSSGDGALIDACERNQSVALACYRKAAERPLPGRVRDVVLQQLAVVERHLAELHALRERADADHR
jgi:uncharacterized protein (TIGR02284 family)